MSTALPKVSGGILSDIVIWVRRLLKSPSTQTISDAVICDYINRFWGYDVSERIQLFEMKRQYTFETIPNVFEYQAPFTTSGTPNFPANPNPPPFQQNPDSTQQQTVVPIYNLFRGPAYCDGVQLGWHQSNEQFYNVFPEYVQNEFLDIGDGVTVNFPVVTGQNPILRGFIDDLGNLEPYVYVTSINNAGDQMYIVDTPYRNADGLGILIQTDASFQNIIGPNLVGNPPTSGGSGTVNYATGQLDATFNAAPADQANIAVQTSPFAPGFPRIILFYNNIFKLYPVPSRAYKIQMNATITPTVFFNSTASVPFAYMSEYIARGATRKILSDNGDMDQFQFYEPLFREQENLVLRRTTRQMEVTRTPTIFSSQTNNQASGWSNGYW